MVQINRKVTLVGLPEGEVSGRIITVCRKPSGDPYAFQLLTGCEGEIQEIYEISIREGKLYCNSNLCSIK